MYATHRLVFGTCLLLLCCAVCIKLYYDNTFVRKFFGKSVPGTPGKEPEEKEIIILSWTKYFSSYKPEMVLNKGVCPHLHLSTSGRVFNVDCRFTNDRKYFEISDALMFHSRDLPGASLPKRKSDEQIWIYLQQESPVHTERTLSDYDNVFNWTETYRRDSDVYQPYGYIVPEKNDKFEIRPEWRNRKDLVAWIVSNCQVNSEREKFVANLKKFIPVDIYGRCEGARKCPENCKSNWDCYASINSSHKFYLSFENSLCLDYITEKFFNALETNMVPVVYGGYSSSDYSGIAPKDSYIDARDFQSTKELADYLIYLDKNNEEYEKYFEWKRKVQVVRVVDGSSQEWCNLCQRLYEERLKSKRKQYEDLKNWWHFYENGSGYFSHTCTSPIRRFTSS